MNARRALWLVLFFMCAGSAAAQYEWVFYEGNPVIGPVEQGSWCEDGRWMDAVVRVDGTYHLFFGGTAEEVFVDHAIGHATSQDGITWEMDPNNPVLTPVAEGDWQVTTYWSTAVVHDGTEFRMWYCGGDGTIFQGGYATSRDGSTWTRHPDNPILDLGPEGAFDDTRVCPSAVVVHGGLYHMWYNASDVPTLAYTGTFGYATSPDGVSWTKHPLPVLDRGTGWESWNIFAPWVVFDGSTYHMWYTGLEGNFAFATDSSIGYATSPDGIAWTKDPQNPIAELGELVSQGVVLFNPVARQFEMFYTDESDAISFNVLRATSACTTIPAPLRPSGRRTQ